MKTKTKTKTKTNPPERETNPFVNEALEDTAYHSYRLSNGGKLSFHRDRRDHVGFIRIRISDCDLTLPKSLDTPWCGWGDASRVALQWLAGLGIQTRIIDKVEHQAEELRRYAEGPRF